MTTNTTLQTDLGAFLMSRFEGEPPEAVPAITVALVNALTEHLAVLNRILEQSGHIDPIRGLAILGLSSESAELDFTIEDDELVRINDGGIPVARRASPEEIELYALVGKLHGDLVWAKASRQ